MVDKRDSIATSCFARTSGIAVWFESFGSKHEDADLRLRDEIRLVFQILNAAAIEKLKLAAGRLEPLERFALHDHREVSLRIGLKFLGRLEAAGEPAKQMARHVAFIDGEMRKSRGTSSAAAV